MGLQIKSNEYVGNSATVGNSAYRLSSQTDMSADEAWMSELNGVLIEAIDVSVNSLDLNHFSHSTFNFQ